MSTSQENRTDADVIVVGGGVAGLTMSVLLGQYGFDVICIDRDDPYQQARADYDRRAIAISYGSHHLLKACGVWDDMSVHGCPIRDIDILDGVSPVLLQFERDQSPEGAFGWIVEMYHIRQALLSAVMASERVQHITKCAVESFETSGDVASVTLADGRTLRSKLIIGADGRGSSVREWLGIRHHSWSYDQRAIVCAVAHDNPHDNIAVEHFHSHGPFAVLPMLDDENGGHRSSIVWTEHCDEEQSILNYSDDVFNTALNEYFPDRYGRVALASKVFSYPLGLIHAHKYYGERAVLIADAAHGIHPVAGQGLNLGFRDIAALAELLVEAKNCSGDIGSEDLLAQYQNMRHFDNMAMAATCDALVKLFSSKSKTVSLARKAGLRLVQRSSFAKKLFARQAMGTAGRLPKLIKGEKI